MNRTLTYSISSAFEGITISQFLKENGYSHPIMVHLKKTPNGILQNGTWAYANQKLSANDTLTIRLIESQSSENIPPTPISTDDFQKMIVYEDADILLINKPAGLPVHPSMGHHEDTLANYCAYYYAQTPENGAFVFRCVNRLDRDTSGLVLIAKNMLSSARLSMSQLSHGIRRTYMAVVTGELPASGTITLPIARKENSVIERCVDLENGEKAITHFSCLECGQIDGHSFSLAGIQLETGRTHQIRVHMQAIGHPLPGDFLYNPDFSYIQRQALHSYCLSFTHPITGIPLEFTQKPPKDFCFIPWRSLA